LKKGKVIDHWESGRNTRNMKYEIRNNEQSRAQRQAENLTYFSPALPDSGFVNRRTAKVNVKIRKILKWNHSSQA